MGNIVDAVKRFSHNNDGAIPVQRCSYLSKGTPRLDKCTCGDNDSSMTGKTASAINGSTDGCEAFYKEVGNEEMQSTTGSTSRQGCLGDIVTLSITHTEPSGGDEANKDRENENETIHTDAREQGVVNRSDSAGLICYWTADHISHNLEDESTKMFGSLTAVISKDLFSTVSPEENCCTDPEVADDLENSPAMDTHKSKELRLHSVSPACSLFDRDAYEKLIDGALNLSCKSIPEASVNSEMVQYEDRAVCAPLDVRGCESTPKASSKKRAKQKRTNRKASNRTMVPNENMGTLVPSDVKYPETVRSPLTRSKANALSVTTPQSPKLENTRSGRLVVRRLDPGSQNIICEVVRSPLTDSKAKVLSVSTPESLKLRSSRSGRLIVPRLDPGTQNIIYDAKGFICGITNSELQWPQGSVSEPPAKRRRRSRCSSPSRGRLLLFDGTI